MEISSELFFLFSGLYLLLLAAFYFLGKSRGMTDVYVRQERMAAEEHQRKVLAEKIAITDNKIADLKVSGEIKNES